MPVSAPGLQRPRGKEKAVRIARKGTALRDRYRAVREDLFMRTVAALAIEETDISGLSALLCGLSGTYDQASRSAAAS